MKNKISKVFVLLFIIFSIILLQNYSYAAIAINGGDTWVNITASNAFNYCLDMKNAGTSTLGQNQLDPHLVTASDWGVCVYLSASNYGGVRDRFGNVISLTSANGPSALASSKNFYTSTGNASGLMDLSATPYQTRYNYYWHTYTASLLSEDADGDGILEYKGDSNYSTLASLIEYRNKDSKYVEALSTVNNDETTKGKAYSEVAGWYGSMAEYPTSTYPLGVRHRALFGYTPNIRKW